MRANTGRPRYFVSLDRKTTRDISKKSRCLSQSKKKRTWHSSKWMIFRTFFCPGRNVFVWENTCCVRVRKRFDGRKSVRFLGNSILQHRMGLYGTEQWGGFVFFSNDQALIKSKVRLVWPNLYEEGEDVRLIHNVSLCCCCCCLRNPNVFYLCGSGSQCH